MLRGSIAEDRFYRHYDAQKEQRDKEVRELSKSRLTELSATPPAKQLSTTSAPSPSPSLPQSSSSSSSSSSPSPPRSDTLVDTSISSVPVSISMPVDNERNNRTSIYTVDRDDGAKSDSTGGIDDQLQNRIESTADATIGIEVGISEVNVSESPNKYPNQNQKQGSWDTPKMTSLQRIEAEKAKKTRYPLYLYPSHLVDH